LEALGGDGSDAPSHPRLELDGSSVPLGSTATHEAIQIPVSVWVRWKSLDTAVHEQLKECLYRPGVHLLLKTRTISPSPALCGVGVMRLRPGAELNPARAGNVAPNLPRTLAL